MILIGVEIPVEPNFRLIRIYFDTATFDDIERDKKIKTEAQVSNELRTFLFHCCLDLCANLTPRCTSVTGESHWRNDGTLLWVLNHQRH